MVTTVAPDTSGRARLTMKPMMWKKGTTASVVARPLTRSIRRSWRADATRLVWVSMTPLGSLVVPLE